GYNKFCRKIYPISSAGSLWSLPLNPTGVFEYLCGEAGQHYDIPESGGVEITNVSIAKQKKNSDQVLGSFFSLDKIKQSCLENGLTFTR
ncbi:hypothetical protein BGZ83_005446, partial [Gryganskiella cystojenkinii]